MDEIIPRDMWLLIASFLEDKSKRQLRLVNTKLFNIIKYNNFNIYFTRKEDVPAITERLSKYSWPIKLTFSKSKFNDLLDVIDHLPKLTNLIELTNIWRFKAEHVTLEQWMQLSVLTNLQVWTAKSPPELDTKFTNLTTCSSFGETEETVALKLKQLSNLKKLYYEGDSNTLPFSLVPNPNGLLILDVIAKNTMVHGADAWCRLTNLVHFSFASRQGTFQNEIKLEYMTSLKYLSLQGLATVPILAANTKLEGLSFGSCTLPSLAANTNLKKLCLHCKNWSLPNSEVLSWLVKLKRLDLYIPTETDDPQWFRFLAHLTQLESLEVKEFDNQKLLNEELYIYIPQQLRELNLSLGKTKCTDIAKLTRLTNLDSLVLREIYQIKNAEHLTALSNITRLVTDAGIGYGNEGGDFCSIGKMTKLRHLELPLQFTERKQPDLSPLKQLTSLRYINPPISKQTQLKHLTNLQSLEICSRYIDKNCYSFAELTNLTCLRVECALSNMDSWQNLVKLTNMQEILLREVDSDDRLLLLTSCTNLTSFSIRNNNKQFTGTHFTALTSLQYITFKCDNAAVAHKKEDIMQCMPYLLGYYQ